MIAHSHGNAGAPASPRRRGRSEEGKKSQARPPLPFAVASFPPIIVPHCRLRPTPEGPARSGIRGADCAALKTRAAGFFARRNECEAEVKRAGKESVRKIDRTKRECYRKQNHFVFWEKFWGLEGSRDKWTRSRGDPVFLRTVTAGPENLADSFRILSPLQESNDRSRYVSENTVLHFLEESEDSRSRPSADGCPETMRIDSPLWVSRGREWLVGGLSATHHLQARLGVEGNYSRSGRL